MLCVLLLGLATSGGLTATVAQKLVPPGFEQVWKFGSSVSVDGDTLVVGADSDSVGGLVMAGSAYVFVDTGTWTFAQRLTSSSPVAGEAFGLSVDLSGDRLVIGGTGLWGTGRAHLFERIDGLWVEHAILTSNDGLDTNAFGVSVAIDREIVVVGAFADDTLGSNAGAAHVYSWVGSHVTFEGKLLASDGSANQNLGKSVAASGGTVLCGAPGKLEGAAYTFTKGPSGWTQEAKLVANDGQKQEEFGAAVAISGSRAVIGAVRDSYGGTSVAGSAYVFERGGGWQQKSKLLPSSSNVFQRFGDAVAIDGDLVVVGAPWDNQLGATAGAAYLYAHAAGKWTLQSKLVPQDTTSSGWLGHSVSISGTTPFVCAPLHATGTTPIQQGAAYAFRIDAPPAFIYCTAGTSASGCAAALTASGSASATASSGFILAASNVEGSRDGLFFFGTSGASALPWGNGTSVQCAGSLVTRLGFMRGTGTPGLCDGSFNQDLNATWCDTCPAPSKNPGAGAVVQAQLWYRDPQNTSNQKTSLSDAVEFVLAP